MHIWASNISRRSRRFTQTNHKTPPSQTVFLCEIMQLAAFLCVICVICGRITRKSTLSISTIKPQCLSQSTQIIADKPPKTTLISPPHQSVFLCVIMQPAAFLCDHLRHLRENTHARVLNQYTQKKPQCLSLITQTVFCNKHLASLYYITL